MVVVADRKLQEIGRLREDVDTAALDVGPCRSAFDTDEPIGRELPIAADLAAAGQNPRRAFRLAPALLPGIQRGYVKPEGANAERGTTEGFLSARRKTGLGAVVTTTAIR